MVKQNKIPKHWQVRKLGDVCKLKNGFAFKSDTYLNEGIPVIRISDINCGIVLSKKAVRVLPKNEYEDYVVVRNDILLAMSGATTGKFGIFKSNEKAYQNQRVGKFKILNDRILNNQFLFHQINALKRQIEKDAYGGAQPNISSAKIEQMLIVLPPLPEQLAIVAKIEELLSDLENGKQQLLTAKQQLKVYRQSLLKWAFEGRLTCACLNVGDLPKSWKIIKLQDLVEKISDGPFGSNLKSVDYVNEGVRVIRLENIGEMEFRNQFNTFVSQEKYETIKNHTVNKGDIIFSSFVAESIRSVILPEYIEKAINKADCFLVRVSDSKINKKYLSFYFSTKSMQNQLVNKIHGATRPRINTTQLKESLIPVPPMEEQYQIVQELESKLTVCDKIEETINQSLQQAETLRQSILKRAFEGKLVKVTES